MSFIVEYPDDINLDGILDILDIVLVINYILGIITLDDIQLENADLNNDGIINVIDIVTLVSIILDDDS